ncbi:MAG: cytochrome c [Opitutaceae bacterium]|jgi:mono/diheme cytochrome c family protein
MKIIPAVLLPLALVALSCGQIVRADDAADAKTIARGKVFYQNCVACHQATGLGVPSVFPPLVGSDWVTGNEDRLIRVVLHGMSGKVTIKDVAYNGNMPAFGLGLGFNWTDDKVAAVLSYVRKSWGNSAPMITKEKVAEVRTKGAPGRKTAWTAAELESFK